MLGTAAEEPPEELPRCCRQWQKVRIAVVDKILNSLNRTVLDLTAVASLKPEDRRRLLYFGTQLQPGSKIQSRDVAALTEDMKLRYEKFGRVVDRFFFRINPCAAEELVAKIKLNAEPLAMSCPFAPVLLDS